jgi:hypothetical protein
VRRIAAPLRVTVKEEGAMRGRYTAAFWLFAVLLLSLLAVGASAPRPRESARLRIARVELARRSAQARPLIEDSAVRPESGCLRDFSMKVRKNEPAEILTTVMVTPSAEARDPSARDFAYHELVEELRQKWAQQPSKLQPAVIVYVSTEVSPASSWSRWETLFIPDLSAVMDGLGRATTEMLETAHDHWESWTRITTQPEFLEVAPLSEGDQAAENSLFEGEMDERTERSILVRAESNRENGVVELAERYDQSILIR